MTATLITWSVLIAAGCLTGFLAGLWGIGGGMIMVPVMSTIFPWLGFPPQYTLHMALATSLAGIIFSSLSSARAHNARGSVLWKVVRYAAPGLLLGTMLGSHFAAALPAIPLTIIFSTILMVFAVQTYVGFKPSSARHLPGPLGLAGFGVFSGGLASIMGIGGGSVNVPFLLYCNVPPQQAVGTSAALGFPMAIFGACGYMLASWDIAGLPAYTLGFIHVPTLVALAVFSVLTAPLGVRLAHRLPASALRKSFCVFLFAVCAKMLLGLL